MLNYPNPYSYVNTLVVMVVPVSVQILDGFKGGREK